MFRSCQIIIRELLCCSLLKLYYNIHNLIRFLQTRCCGSMSCCVGMCCRENSPSLRGIRRTPSQLLFLHQIPTQLDMLPQHLVCKNELSSLFIILQIHSICFWCQPHPSSAAHKTVTTASSTGHIFGAVVSLQHGQV